VVSLKAETSPGRSEVVENTETGESNVLGNEFVTVSVATWK